MVVRLSLLDRLDFQRFHLLECGIDAVLGDEADAGAADLEGDPFFLGGHPETLLVQIDFEEFAGMVHGMGNLHALLAFLTGYFANSAHTLPRQA